MKNLMNELLATCIREPGNELISAECENLTGGKPDKDGVALCRTLEHVHKAAYVRAGIQCLAGGRGETLDRLVKEIAEMTFGAQDFRIEFLRLSERIQVRQYEAIIAVANAIDASPNLDAPRHRFLLAVQDDGLWFGEILTEADGSYVRHTAKPYRTSSSLPSRLSRALVNLVVPPARTILDLCCGTGSILFEAQAIGVTAYGADWNPRMVGMSRKNLAHFGYAANVELADAREWNRTADALVTDLPYGRRLAMDSQVVRGILAHATCLAPVAVYVAGSDISDWLREAGYGDIEVFHVSKGARFTRYIHRARSCNWQGGSKTGRAGPRDRG
jgi:tRNA G10  N-methylase Trm11